jgi:phage terminase large subunit
MEQRKIALTPVFQKLKTAFDTCFYDVFVLEGGSRSSKTHSIIQFWIAWANENKGKKKRVVVARLKATWVTATVLYDFIQVLKDYGLYDKRHHNKSVGAGVYTLYDTEFWFLGLDDEQRIHGMKSDAFWINEAIEANYDDYANLKQRSGFGILDYNPSFDEHWVYDKVCKRPKTCFIHSTMLDNPFISKSSKEQILSYEPTDENRKNGTADKRKWEIYGLGKRSSLEGLIFDNFELVKEVPHWIKRSGYGIDFGYTNDVTAISDNGIIDRCLYIDEKCYRTYMLTKDIIDEFKKMPPKRVISESADPRLITEIALAGINIAPVEKYPGSVNAGIDAMKSYKIYITETSINAIKEFKNYTWQFDEKTGKFINKPVDSYNHIVDSVRYWVLGEILGKIGTMNMSAILNAFR